jgi:hypothetical protein
VQHKKCKSTKCVGVGGSSLCGWRTPANGKTKWKRFGTQGLYVDVNTSWCAFPEGSLPQYVVSLENANRSPYFGLFRGSVSLLRYSRDSFRAVVWLTTMAGAGHGAFDHFARKYGWRLSWMGDSGQNAGMSFRGQTGWRQVGEDGLYATIDTTESGFLQGAQGAGGAYLSQLPRSSLPPLREGGSRRLRSAGGAQEANNDFNSVRYLVSICGSARQWRVQGSHVVIDPRRTSFQFYLHYKKTAEKKSQYKHGKSPLNAKPLATMAEELLWTVSWIGEAKCLVECEESCRV